MCTCSPVEFEKANAGCWVTVKLRSISLQNERPIASALRRVQQFGVNTVLVVTTIAVEH